MVQIKENFVMDDKGNRTAVLIDIKDYERLREYIEDLEDAKDLIEAEKTATGFTTLENFQRELKSEGRL